MWSVQNSDGLTYCVTFWHEIVATLFGATYAAPIQCCCFFIPINRVESYIHKTVRFKYFSWRTSQWFSALFKIDLIFKDFSREDNPYSSTFQACMSPVTVNFNSDCTVHVAVWELVVRAIAPGKVNIKLFHAQFDWAWHLFQGSYRPVCIKFKDFTRTSKLLSWFSRTTNLWKILICMLYFYFTNAWQNEIMEKLAFENLHKLCMPFLVHHIGNTIFFCFYFLFLKDTLFQIIYVSINRVKSYRK